MKLQSLPTFLVRRKNWLLMAALALSLTAALLLRPSSPQAQRVTLPMTSAESAAKTPTALRGKARRRSCKPTLRCIRRS